MKPRIKNHFRAHQLSIWLRLIPELHRAGMEDVITRHNLFKNHDDMDLYDGPVKLDSLSRLAFLEETFKQRRNNGTNNEYSLLNINGKCVGCSFVFVSFAPCDFVQSQCVTQWLVLSLHGLIVQMWRGKRDALPKRIRLDACLSSLTSRSRKREFKPFV